MRIRSFQLKDAKDYIVTALLLIIALAIMVSRYQGGLHSLRQVSIMTYSLLEEPLANIRIYRQALNTNTYLQRQNILLQDEVSRLRSLDQENQVLREMLGYQDTSEFDLQPVLIVGKDITGINNFLTIDAGYADSVKSGMPLVTSDGIVGKVLIVGKYFSQVMPFYNSLFRVSARLQENQAHGIVSWTGEPFGELVLDFVPKTIPVDTGFVVETSGYSNQYPPGIPIGKVTRTEDQQGRETQRIFIEPFVSLSDIAKGFVIEFQPDTGIANTQLKYDEIFK